MTSKPFADAPSLQPPVAAEQIDVVVNGQPRRLPAGATIAALLAELALRPQYVAVELNLELVPRALHSTRELRAGDRLEIVTLVGGG